MGETVQPAWETIRSFLEQEAAAGTVKVGFHRMRDQSVLLERLRQNGIRKPFFTNRRQFLRDIITCDPSAFQAVVDLICIHSVRQGREVFWDADGEESAPQLWLESEVMYRLETQETTEAFVGVLSTIQHQRESKTE